MEVLLLLGKVSCRKRAHGQPMFEKITGRNLSSWNRFHLTMNHDGCVMDRDAHVQHTPGTRLTFVFAASVWIDGVALYTELMSYPIVELLLQHFGSIMVYLSRSCPDPKRAYTKGTRS